mmetsp:Transcript_2125/g.5264  ORF Transcript_2125/g.5264 Transcript_2125/m.5264 type:complete len:166 (+) Transcript_2125:170-667(+)
MADKLTEEDANSRKATVSNVEYELALRLFPSYYEGHVKIKFNAHSTSTFLDFSGKTLQLGGIGERQYGVVNWVSPRVYLTSLIAGRCEFSFAFTCEYSMNGTGLFKYVDPEDGKHYLYSYFCPYYANCVFPCFDQPDIKALLKLVVIAPSIYFVISNVKPKVAAD